MLLPYWNTDDDDDDGILVVKYPEDTRPAVRARINVNQLETVTENVRFSLRRHARCYGSSCAIMSFACGTVWPIHTSRRATGCAGRATGRTQKRCFEQNLESI